MNDITEKLAKSLDQITEEMNKATSPLQKAKKPVDDEEDEYNSGRTDEDTTEEDELSKAIKYAGELANTYGTAHPNTQRALAKVQELKKAMEDDGDGSDSEDASDDDTMTCPKCGEEIPADSTTCPECGYDIEDDPDNLE